MLNVASSLPATLVDFCQHRSALTTCCEKKNLYIYILKLNDNIHTLFCYYFKNRKRKRRSSLFVRRRGLIYRFACWTCNIDIIPISPHDETDGMGIAVKVQKKKKSMYQI